MLEVLQIKNLTKKYGNKTVVDNVSFSMLPGEILGFVGPNGAGKSTTIKMITGLSSITAGSVYISGYSVSKNFSAAIKNVGAVVETPQLYPYLSGEKNLKLFASFYGKKALGRIPKILKLVGLENRAKDKIQTYSLGMKQRIGIAQALLCRPKLLILDEPTNGLDPNGIVEIRNTLKVLAEKEQMAIIISSHNLAELEHICDYICVINAGKIIENKPMAEIKDILSDKQRVQLLCNYPNYAALMLKKYYNIKAEVVGTSIIAPVKESNLAVIISFLLSKRVKIFGIKKITKSLEELYFELLNNDRASTSII